MNSLKQREQGAIFTVTVTVRHQASTSDDSSTEKRVPPSLCLKSVRNCIHFRCVMVVSS